MRLYVPIVLFLTAAPAVAGAMAQACMEKPAARPREFCTCVENEFNRRLTSEERKTEILTFKGKYQEYNKKVNAMGKDLAKDFGTRVAASLQACQS
jgi:hypothetical protein